MLTALLLILSVAQAPGDWRAMETPGEEGTMAWRLAADDAGGGDERRIVLRMTGPDLSWASGEMDIAFACAGQTWTILSARAFDEAGALARSVTPTPEQLRPEPLYADDGGYAAVYAELCPGGAPLPERPNHPPPVAVPVPRG